MPSWRPHSRCSGWRLEVTVGRKNEYNSYLCTTGYKPIMQNSTHRGISPTRPARVQRHILDRQKHLRRSWSMAGEWSGEREWTWDSSEDQIGLEVCIQPRPKVSQSCRKILLHVDLPWFSFIGRHCSVVSKLKSLYSKSGLWLRRPY